MVCACSGLGCTGSNLKPRCLRLTFIWASLADDQFGTEMSFGATASELIGPREPLTCGPPRPQETRMPSTILDSAVFRDIFTTPAMREVWSDENRVQKYLDFEAALARAQGKLGIIPKEAAAEIV